MAYRNLDEFLTRLEQGGNVAHFTSVQPEDDFSEIAPQDASKVHLFTDPNGTRIVRNLFGTSQRVEQALLVASLDLIAERLEQLLEIGKPGALGVMISRAMTMFSAIRTTTNRRAPGEFQVSSFLDWRNSLGVTLRILQSDSIQATLLTGGETPRMASISMLVGEDEIAGTFWPDLAVGETVALVIGGDPAFMFAAHAPLPDIVHRSYFASWLRDKPLDMMRMPGLDIEVPSNADIVISATVTKQYSEDTTLEVSSVWTKPDPIYTQFIRDEHYHVRDAFVRIMLPIIKRFLPGVRDVRLRNQFGILTVDPFKANRHTIFRQLWAVPIFEDIAYWIMLPDIDDVEGAVERLSSNEVVDMSKLVSAGSYAWVLLDASWKSDRPNSWLPETDVEIEHILGLIKNNWRQDTPAGES